MLDFTGFKSEFVSCCKSSLSALVDPSTDHDFMIEERTVTKAQVGKLSALIFRSPGFFCAPTVYVEDFYRMYRDGHSVKDLSVTAVNSVYPYIRCAPSFPDDAFDNAENLRVRLLNRALNRAFLQTVPFIDTGCGLTLVAEFRSGEYRASVTAELLEALGMDRDELFETALSNSSLYDPPVLFELSELLMSGKDMCDNLLEKDSGYELSSVTSLYMLSNDKCFWGAAALFYPEMMQRLSRLMGGAFYVLPSSVHEVLVMPVADGDPQMLADTIRSANRSVVEEEEFLSDDLYICDNGTLRRVSYGGVACNSVVHLLRHSRPGRYSQACTNQPYS